jgi:hypothetical protein
METMFWIVCALLFAGVLVVKYRKYNVRRALQMPKNPPIYPDSAIKSARAIGDFLFERAEAAGVYFINSGDKTGMSVADIHKLSDGKDYGVINLIRMAHYLGCEIVVRQMGTQDTEDPATTPQVFAEYIANLKDEELRINGLN